MPTEILIGNPDSEHVRAILLGRALPDRDDSADGNWIAVQLDLVVFPFSGSFRCMWRAEFIAQFRKSLEELYANLDGTAVFGPDWEGSLELQFRGDGLGHVAVTGSACADSASGPWLRFSLPELDQTYLPDLISTLQAVEVEFPIR